MFMAAKKRNAERGKTTAVFHVGFGVPCELRHCPTL